MLQKRCEFYKFNEQNLESFQTFQIKTRNSTSALFKALPLVTVDWKRETGIIL